MDGTLATLGESTRFFAPFTKNFVSNIAHLHSYGLRTLSTSFLIATE